ncbi:MAG: ABC transporter ATP-binding protein, partial [Clostridia bacterium]|nr:ABC transporter ATP-binding protein [Clostridia bacterium]
EVLSVGDAAFKEKSERRLESLMSDGVTVLFVSHSTDRVERICNKAIILTQGQLVANGDSADVCALYRNMVLDK